MYCFGPVKLRTYQYSLMSFESTTTDHDKLTANQLIGYMGDPKYYLTIPRAILPKPSLSDEITVTKLLVYGQSVVVS